jgi:hypothetical protein
MIKRINMPGVSYLKLILIQSQAQLHCRFRHNCNVTDGPSAEQGHEYAVVLSLLSQLQ